MKFTTILLCAVFCFAALLGSAQGQLSPYPADCSKYKSCGAAGCFIMSCAAGTEFNPSIGNCDYPQPNPPGCDRH